MVLIMSKTFFVALFKKVSAAAVVASFVFTFRSSKLLEQEPENIRRTNRAMYFFMAMILKLEVDSETNISGSGQNTTLISLDVPGTQTGFGIGIGGIFMDDPKIGAYQGKFNVFNFSNAKGSPGQHIGKCRFP